ncbi:MAG TPA: right-handed parallel beta-helix repeat-containing protein [Thermoanaerobaculia bacterium]|nr:right-handed parallel beta-helix repeat-containing protein [Thermoanaerobaculia bacterium]
MPTLKPFPSLAALAFVLLSLPGIPSVAADRPTALDSSAESDAYYRGLRSRLTAGEPADRVIDDLLGRVQTSELGDVITSCPATPPGGYPGVTNQGFYFLTEILPAGVALDSPACGQFLRCFLGQMVAHQQNPAANPPSPHSEATLIIDRQCVVNTTLFLPNRFVLAGVGTEGRGVLVFDLPDGWPAIRFAPSTDADLRFVTIRDLNLVNASCCGQVGIDVSHSSQVNLERLRIHDFGFGVLGSTAYSITIEESDIHNNGFNLVLGEDTTAWRVRDTVLNQSGLIGAVLLPTSRGNLISGGRVESNPITGVYLRGPQNTIENGWFEGNGIGFGDHGIRVAPSADQSHVLSNLFSTEDVLDQGTRTKICFNSEDEVANNCF